MLFLFDINRENFTAIFSSTSYNILRDEGPINPVGDKEIIETELQLKDIESVEKKMQRTEKLLKQGDAKLKCLLYPSNRIFR